MENRRSRFLPLLAIILCMTMIVGATFALFTSKKKINIAVNAAEVDVQAYIIENSLKTYSMGVEQNPGDFELGGKATLEATGDLTLDLMAPGDKAEFTVVIEDESTVDVMWRVTWKIVTDANSPASDFAKALVVTADGEPYKNTQYTKWTCADDEVVETVIAVELPYDVKDAFQNGAATITFTVEAVQGNMPDPVEGDAAYAWLIEPLAEDSNTTNLTLDSAEDFLGFASLVGVDNSTSTISTEDDPAAEALKALSDASKDTTFEGMTITLTSNVDLTQYDENGELVAFDPIGSYRFDQSFKGTFDGNNKTITGLNQNTWALNNGFYYNDCGLGLFGSLEDATVKNLIIDGANISGESALCGTVAAVAHNTTFENITIKNANVADYQYYAGGIVGWASGECTFTNINIDASTTIAAQWGDFDNSIGGVIGGASGSAKILIKDSTIACRIDAYNDVTSTYRWYAYRRAGMLIGNSNKTETNENGTTVAVCPQLTCENVTVIYGTWANYTYCEFAGTSWPYVRVQAGVSNSGYSNPRYGHPKDANGNEVVDDNHVHNDGEDHFIDCTFDQLYGGGQGVYGNPAHEGVTVIYNNK